MKSPDRRSTALFQGSRAVAVRDHARAWWSGRTPRERRLLLLAAWVIGLAAVWAWGIKPSLDAVARLHERLPVLRAETAHVGALAMEAQGLRRRPAVTGGGLDTGAVRDSLRRAGLKQAAMLAEAAPDNAAGRVRWEVVFTHADAASVMTWLASLPGEAPVQVTRVSLRRSRADEGGRPGQISGTLVLQAGSAGKEQP